MFSSVLGAPKQVGLDWAPAPRVAHGGVPQHLEHFGEMLGMSWGLWYVGACSSPSSACSGDRLPS